MKKARMADPLWVEICTLYDELSQTERAALVRIVRCIVHDKLTYEVQQRSLTAPSVSLEENEAGQAPQKV